FGKPADITAMMVPASPRHLEVNRTRSPFERGQSPAVCTMGLRRLTHRPRTNCSRSMSAKNWKQRSRSRLERAADDLAQQGGLLLLLRLDIRRPPGGLEGGLGGVHNRVVVALTRGEGGVLVDYCDVALDRREVGLDALPAAAHEFHERLAAHPALHALHEHVRP